MKALIAVVCGIAISFLLVSILAFLSMNFRIYPFYDFYIVVKDIYTKEGSHNYTKFFELGQNILYVFALAVFPIISFITSFITTLILNKKEFLLGILSLLPVYIVFYLYPGSFSVYSIYSLITLTVFAAIGTYSSKALKRIRQRALAESEHRS